MICNNCKINEVPAYRKTLCDGCANMKQLAFEASKKITQVPKGDPRPDLEEMDGTNEPRPKDNGVKKENGDYQSTVFNRTVAPNSYEVGKVGNRFKLYFETPQELKDKMQELKDAGLMDTLSEDIVTGE